jgi:hypothetical protein
MIKEIQNFNENLTNKNATNDIIFRVPKKVFIVPYRNRLHHKFFFCKYMSFILENEDDYEIYFSHQCDARNFNRGATKNIGFLAMKQKYPNDYKNITFIFNDVDTIPFTKIFDYETSPGVVKHYYGFTYTLGGIVVIKGGDFEMINGYPNFWGWGNEDNCLQKRCERFRIKIDRSVFYPIGSPEILQLFDGISRIISKKDPWRMKYDDGYDGIRSLHKLYYTIDNESKNPDDNVYSIENDKIFYINIATFLAGLRHEEDDYYSYDLREPARKIIHPNKLKKTNKTFVSTDDWRNIPYYSKQQESLSNVERDNIEMAQHITNIEREMTSQKDVTDFNNRMNPQIQHLQEANYRPKVKTPSNIFSQEYARQINQRPLATPSARIGLGGLR